MTVPLLGKSRVWTFWEKMFNQLNSEDFYWLYSFHHDEIMAIYIWKLLKFTAKPLPEIEWKKVGGQYGSMWEIGLKSWRNPNMKVWIQLHYLPSTEDARLYSANIYKHFPTNNREKGFEFCFQLHLLVFRSHNQQANVTLFSIQTSEKYSTLRSAKIHLDRTSGLLVKSECENFI